MSLIESKYFANLFADIATVCGHEANYQAHVADHLADCFGINRVAREYKDSRVGRGGIDVALLDKANGVPCISFEIKGGAYGDRNALKDTIDSNGYCKDMDRLNVLAKDGVECWFLCVDAVELGRVMDDTLLRKASDNCRAKNIGFAYLSQDEKYAHIWYPDGRYVEPELISRDSNGASAEEAHNLLLSERFWKNITDEIKTSSAYECDIQALIYRNLRQSRCAPSQVSLETYFNFAVENGKRMQKRPDICLFEPSIDGHFNLYANGKRSQTNDPRKLSSLCAVIEIKGGRSLQKSSDRLVMQKYVDDLNKLIEWRGRIERHPSAPDSISAQCHYHFVAVDLRKKLLGKESLSELETHASEASLRFHYLN